MPSRTPRVTLGGLLFGLLVGTGIGLLIWWGYLTQQGEAIGPALRGEVEDALGVLQGVVTLGASVGGGVGLIYGIWSANRQSKQRPPTP
jgi:hypothetical protein